LSSRPSPVNLADRISDAGAEDTSQLASELRAGDNVNDEVVRVDERAETVESGQRVLDDHVTLSYDVGDE